MKIDLNGSWLFRNLTDNGDYYKAIVPSTNYSDLIRNNLIPDPFKKLNEKITTWVGDKDWLYTKEFTIGSEVFDYEKVELVADCLDAITEIYLNETLIGKTFNAHVGYKFDVKSYLKIGQNKLDIKFISPVNYAKKEKERIGKTSVVKSFDKRIFIRKNQSHFDWDWGPEIPYSGITKDIFIECGSGVSVADLLVEQEHFERLVNLDISFNIEGELPKDKVVYYTIKITAPSGEVILKTGVANSKVNRTIAIENPLLWWTHELNPIDEQPLYKVEIFVGENGELAMRQANIGLRKIELDRSKDQFGSNFRFILNGVPIFCKGANLIPFDSLIDRVGRKDIAFYVNTAVESNMNMLRVWGGGFYGDDIFYDECDKKGILVWQDFCFACRPYPFFDQSFLSKVIDEIAFNVKRLRNHPSLALWCGNNEIEQMSNTWLWHKGMIRANKEFFWNTLEKELRKYDKVTPFIPTSPVGVEFNKGVSSDNHGDNHLWVVWHGLQDVKYYRKRKTRFCSEFGFESLPDMKTIKQYADEEDYSITSKVFLAHQKCMLGNQKMEYYITSRFRLPKNFEDYVYLSQACQMECIKDATEFWRRNRDRCNGSLYWQFNDCWPVCSWSSVDYYGNYKALQYHAKHFFAPIMLSIEGDKKGVKVFVLNDTLKDVNCKLNFKIVDFDKGVLATKQWTHSISSLSVIKVYDESICEFKKKYDLNNIAIVCDLLVGDKVVNTKTFLFKYEKHLSLKKVNYKMDYSIDNGCVTLNVSSDKFARLVRIDDVVNNTPFSDNWFDLVPNEAKTITFPYYEGFTIDNLKIQSSVDIEPKGSKLYDSFIKAKFILNPVNLAIYVAQPRSNFDYKHYEREN